MKVLSFIENAFSGLFFLVGISISLYSVFMRYIVGDSQSWATEIYTMLLVWAIFIGFSTALRDNKHIAIDLLYDRAGPLFRKICEIFTLVLGIAFSIFIIQTGVDMVLTAYAQGIKTVDVGFPIWVNYLIMPIAGTLLFIRFCEKAYKYFIKKEIYTKEQPDESTPVRKVE
ncbi:TRAP transporter small permease [Halobacillus sp. B23F22_1]|uniref:TRAP transporter small permease n=1 Tax=Halobacillus sp. B23F22_1 TaxID=3459514 RepID=UPI00373E25C3